MHFITYSGLIFDLDKLSKNGLSLHGEPHDMPHSETGWFGTASVGLTIGVQDKAR